MTRELSPDEQNKLLKTVEQLRRNTEDLYKENLQISGEFDKVIRSSDDLVHENIVLKGELEVAKARIHVLERSLKKIHKGNKLFLPITAGQLDVIVHEVEYIFDKTQDLHSCVYNEREYGPSRTEAFERDGWELFHHCFNALDSVYKKLIGIKDTCPRKGEFLKFWNCLHTEKDEGVVKEIFAPRLKIETPAGDSKTVLWSEVIWESTEAADNTLFDRDSAQTIEE